MEYPFQSTFAALPAAGVWLWYLFAGNSFRDWSYLLRLASSANAGISWLLLYRYKAGPAVLSGRSQPIKILIDAGTCRNRTCARSKLIEILLIFIVDLKNRTYNYKAPSSLGSKLDIQRCHRIALCNLLMFKSILFLIQCIQTRFTVDWPGLRSLGIDLCRGYWFCCGLHLFFVGVSFTTLFIFLMPPVMSI